MSSLLRVRFGGTVVGLPAVAVREVVRAPAIAPLPGAPAIVEGAVNVRGEIVPVIDVRQRLAFPPKALDPDEFLVVFRTRTRTLAFRVDDVDDLVDVGALPSSTPAALSPVLRGLVGLSAMDDGVLVVFDPDAFISQAETESLDAALAARP